MKGIVESLGIGELAEQIKSVSAALEAANKDFLTFGESIKGIFNDLIATYKEVKKAQSIFYFIPFLFVQNIYSTGIYLLIFLLPTSA
jgi:hypothetical protein